MMHDMLKKIYLKLLSEDFFHVTFGKGYPEAEHSKDMLSPLFKMASFGCCSQLGGSVWKK